MHEQLVTLNVNDGIAKVSLNRPDKHNALNMQMFVAIDKVIKKIRSDRQIRVVIVSGAGASFCSGLDVKAVLSHPSSAIKLLWKWLPGNANLAQRVCIGWRRLPIPVIMVLHGKCWGGGMQIALGGDFRIAAKPCSLSVMEARWGLIPDMGGTVALKECMSADQAIKLAMSAAPISASEALDLGLVTEICDDPEARALALAKQLSLRSPDTNKTIKKLYHKIWSGSERRILAGETLNQIRILAGQNQRIAVKREMGQSEINYK